MMKKYWAFEGVFLGINMILSTIILIVYLFIYGNMNLFLINGTTIWIQIFSLLAFPIVLLIWIVKKVKGRN